MAGPRLLRISDFLLLLVAWFTAALSACVITAFFSSPAPSLYQVSFIPLLVTVLVAVPIYFGLQALRAMPFTRWLAANWPTLAVVLLVGRFAYRIVGISFSFPNLLALEKFSLPAEFLAVFIVSVLAGLGAAWLLVTQLPTRAARVVFFLGEHARGLLLAALFFIVYFTLANVFNRQDFNTNNVFFAADSHQWQLRLAGKSGTQMEMRAIHPLAFLILRPAVFAISLLFAAQPINALLFLLALVGSAGLFLAWLFLYRATRNANFALLFTALLGISTTNLVFNALAETYLFSAFLLILFFVLLQNGPRLRWLVLTGLAAFGVTISNLVQNMVGLIIVELKVRRALLFVLWIVGLGAALNLLSRQLFPDSAFFFDPSAYGVESQHYQLGSTVQDWTARAGIVTRDMFLFSVIAPQPFLLNYNRDVRGEFPKFNFMLGERSSAFIGLGKIAAWLWVGLLLGALGAFAYSLRREGLTATNRFGLAFLGCLAFNFVFHFFYGFEPFLYAADWTYALVFFAALGLSAFADNKVLQAALLVLLALLTLNNLSFVDFLLKGLSPYIPNV